jgi:hypothetical protein
MPKTSVPARGDALPALTRRSLLAGAGTMAATALTVSRALATHAPAAGAIVPDADLSALARQFDQALVAFEAAHQRYCQCERRFFALRRGARTKAARARIRRETDVAAAEAAADAAARTLHELMQQMLAAPARSLAGLAVKARAVKRWGYPEWWDMNAEVSERLAAQVLDAVIDMAGGDLVH